MKLINPIKALKSKVKTLKTIVGEITQDKWEGIGIALDLIYTRFRYKITIEEYRLYNFHRYAHRYRKNFLLNIHRRKYHYCLKPGFTNSKFALYKNIPDLYSRDIILIPYCGEEKFLDFLKKHKRIIVKPDIGSLGNGVQILEYTDDETAKLYFAMALRDNPIICEKLICQHEALRQLNPYSVNTIRFATVLVQDQVEVVAAVLKMGAGSDSITDNMSKGGLGAQIDIETGVVCSFGKDFARKKYTHHPVTGAQIIGLQIPYWNEAVELVKQAHKRLPYGMIYGWDVAITETGVDIVEGNGKPGSRIMQTMDGIPKGEKIIPILKKSKPKGPRKQLEVKPDYRKYFPDASEE